MVVCGPLVFALLLKCYICLVRYLNYAIASTIIFLAGTAIAQTQFEKDSTKALECFKLFQKYEYEDTMLARLYSDSSIYYAYESKSNDLKGRAHQFKGWYYQDCARFKEATAEFFSSLAYLRKAGNEQGVADAYGNIGNSYLDMDDYRKSLEYQQLSLTENDKILQSTTSKEDKKWAEEGRNYALHNIASIYQNLGLYDKALEYERESVQYELKKGDQVGAAISYNTLASIHNRMENKDSAEYYFEAALKIYETETYPIGYATVLHRYATMEGCRLSERQREEMLYEALAIYQERGAIDSEMLLLIDIGSDKFDDLSTDSLSSLLETIYANIKAYELFFLEESYFRLYSRYNSRIGQYDSAYFALENFIELKAISDEKKRSHDLVAQDIRFELENGFALERLKHQEDINEVQNYVYLSVIGLLIVLVTLFYLIQRNRRGKRINTMLSDKNELIQEQKEIVEDKNRSISDSINYAQRLQTAILPTSEYVNEYLPDSFLFFQPKDIVSGDFHWFEVKDDLIFIAVADCTGHGVPGALVSVVCSNALNSALNEFGLRSPAEILNKTRQLVIERFAQSDDEVSDGMDIGLCCVDKSKHKLTFAGANNPVWIVRKNDHINDEGDNILEGKSTSLIEIKGDKQPIGRYASLDPFLDKMIDLQPGDIVYLCTDGFADQFGGEKGKKFKYRPFKQLLLDLSELPLSKQGAQLAAEFNQWKGAHEQVDDVCVVGFRMS